MLRWGIWLGPIGILLIALADMPYGYYQILRVILFCASVYLAIAEGRRDGGFWLWAFIASALIYNPIATLSLGREIWTIVNVMTIAIFGVHFWTRKNSI